MNCTAHPAEPITGACPRCGNFVCRLDATPDGHCAACGSAPVEDAEAFRASVWGKRDAFGWWYGLFGTGLSVFFAIVCAGCAIVDLTGGALGAGFLGQGVPLLGVAFYSFVVAALEVAYFRQSKRVRTVVALIPPPAFFFFVVMILAEGHPRVEMALMMFGGAVAYAWIPLVIGAASLLSPRNKLAFEIEVPARTVEQLATSLRNRYAHVGLLLSFVGALVPGVSIVALALCVAGLGAVDSNARPPVGGLVRAVVGLGMAALTTIAWAVMILGVVVGNSGR